MRRKREEGEGTAIWGYSRLDADVNFRVRAFRRKKGDADLFAAAAFSGLDAIRWLRCAEV